MQEMNLSAATRRELWPSSRPGMSLGQRCGQGRSLWGLGAPRVPSIPLSPRTRSRPRCADGGRRFGGVTSGSRTRDAGRRHPDPLSDHRHPRGTLGGVLPVREALDPPRGDRDRPQAAGLPDPGPGAHVYACPNGHEIHLVPHSCKSRFCPTCGKHATDQWADGALSDLLEVPYHHLVLSAPCQLRGIMALNRQVCLSILVRAATACFNQWAREQYGMRMGIVTVIHTFGSDLRWHPHLHLLVT